MHTVLLRYNLLVSVTLLERHTKKLLFKMFLASVSRRHTKLNLTKGKHFANHTFAFISRNL